MSPVHGGLTPKREQINQAPSDKAKKDRDTKRRTVQVEYVAPHSQTVRGEASPPAAPITSSKSRVKESGPVEVPSTDGYNARPSHSAAVNSPPRPGREPQRSVSDYTAFGTMPPTTARPSTGGTLGAHARLPSRGNSYSMPSTATVAPTNAEGRFSQPKGKQYHISAPIAQPEQVMGQPSIGPPPMQRVQSIQAESKGHKRSNTVSETLGRVTSMFSTRQPSYSLDPKDSSTSQNSDQAHEKRPQKFYPPTSMPGSIANADAHRQSTESTRRTSFGFSRKSANNSDNGGSGGGKSSRRFSLLPSSLSKTFSSNHRESMPATSQADRRGSAATSTRPRASSRPGMSFGRGNNSRSPSQSTTGSTAPGGMYDGPHDGTSSRHRGGPSSAPPNQTHFTQHHQQQPSIGDDKFPNPRGPHPSSSTQSHNNQPYPHHHQNDSQTSDPALQNLNHRPQYPQGMGSDSTEQQQQRKGVLQKSRKFADAYEESGNNKGSSGSSKRVMDFFRRMGRQRGSKEAQQQGDR
jgi:protein-serine/threonine kinase